MCSVDLKLPHIPNAIGVETRYRASPSEPNLQHARPFAVELPASTTVGENVVPVSAATSSHYTASGQPKRKPKDCKGRRDTPQSPHSPTTSGGTGGLMIRLRSIEPSAVGRAT